MKKFLFLLSMIYLSFQVSNSFKVIKICSKDVFKHNGATVDSVVKINKKIIYDLKAFELNVNLTEGFDPKDWEERVDVAFQNGEHMLGLSYFLNAYPLSKKFSPSFNETFLDNRKKRFESLKKELLKLQKKYSNEKYNSIYAKILRIMDKPLQLIEDLRPMARNLINEKMFTKNELQNLLNNYMLKLRVKNLPLGTDNVDEYLDKKIVSFDYSKHKFNETVTFFYNVYIPATKSRFPVIGSCLKTSGSLPPFFKN